MMIVQGSFRSCGASVEALRRQVLLAVPGRDKNDKVRGWASIKDVRLVVQGEKMRFTFDACALENWETYDRKKGEAAWVPVKEFPTTITSGSHVLRFVDVCVEIGETEFNLWTAGSTVVQAEHQLFGEDY